MGNEPKKVQCIEIVRIYREYLAVDGFGFRQAASLMMLNGNLNSARKSYRLLGRHGLAAMCQSRSARESTSARSQPLSSTLPAPNAFVSGGGTGRARPWGALEQLPSHSNTSSVILIFFDPANIGWSGDGANGLTPASG